MFKRLATGTEVKRLANGNVAHGCEACDGEDECTCRLPEKTMALEDALRWADINCTPEATERLRSRAVVKTLAAEVRRLMHNASLSGAATARKEE